MKHILNQKHTVLLSVALVLVLSLALGSSALAAEGRTVITDEEIDSIINTTTDASLVDSPFTAVANSVRASVVGINNYQNARSNNKYTTYKALSLSLSRDCRESEIRAK